MQSISWSKGLRNLLNLGSNKTDEQLVEDLDVGDEVVEMIPHVEWLRIRREGREVEVFEEIEARLCAQKFYACDEWGEVSSVT